MTANPPDTPPQVPAEPQMAPTAPPGPVKRCGLAIASLVCGIIGPLTVGLASIVAVILGIVGCLPRKGRLLCATGYIVDTLDRAHG